MANRRSINSKTLPKWVYCAIAKLIANGSPYFVLLRFDSVNE